MSVEQYGWDLRTNYKVIKGVTNLLTPLLVRRLRHPCTSVQTLPLKKPGSKRYQQNVSFPFGRNKSLELVVGKAVYRPLRKTQEIETMGKAFFFLKIVILYCVRPVKVPVLKCVCLARSQRVQADTGQNTE